MTWWQLILSAIFGFLFLLWIIRGIAVRYFDIFGEQIPSVVHLNFVNKLYEQLEQQLQLYGLSCRMVQATDTHPRGWLVKDVAIIHIRSLGGINPEPEKSNYGYYVWKVKEGTFQQPGYRFDHEAILFIKEYAAKSTSSL